MACIDDGAYKDAATAQGDAEIKAATTQAAISAAVLAIQIAMRSKISDMEYEIRDRQVKIAETLRSQAEKYWTQEKLLLTEVCSEPIAVADYGLSNTLINHTLAAQTAFDACASTSCAEPDPCFDAQRANIRRRHEVDVANFGMRRAEADERALNEQRWSRRNKVLQLFRGMYTGPDSFLQHAGRSAGARGTAIGTIIEGALDAAGFETSLKPTQLPNMERKEYSWGHAAVAQTTQPIVVNTVTPPTIGTPTGQVVETDYSPTKTGYNLPYAKDDYSPEKTGYNVPYANKDKAIEPFVNDFN